MQLIVFFSNSFQTHPLTDSLETPVVANVSLPRSTVGDQARYNTAPSGSVINLREELRKMVSVMMQKRGAVLRFVCIQSVLLRKNFHVVDFIISWKYIICHACVLQILIRCFI